MSERTAYKNYFYRAAISLLAALVVLFYGCKQLSHTEKDKYDFGQNKVDSVAVVPERIVDTITLVLDSIQLDTLTFPTPDSLAIPIDSLALSDTLIIPADSLQVDTL